MRSELCRIALLSAVLPLAVVGCAAQGGATAETAPPATSAPQVVASVPEPVGAPPPSTAASPQPAGATQHAAKTRPQLPPPSALETRYGIQITQLGITAAGGLVDFRFKVLDAAKARKLLADPANMPVLIAGNNPPLAPPRHALHGAKFGDGAVYYILYPNVRNAIKPGVEVTVAMGDVRFGPVMAQ